MENSITPTIFSSTEKVLTDLTTSLQLPREILPPQKEIDKMVGELPDLLLAMKEELRDEKIAKMCLAAGVGLFDAAINYVWNQTVIVLRKSVIAFGLTILSGIKGKNYEEKDIDELQDSELLDLCLELSILDDEAYYFLSQCRDMRNNCSIAHPSVGEINRAELLAYIDRCVRYALNDKKQTLVGVDIKKLLSVLGAAQFDAEQMKHWKEKISSTNKMQKITIFKMFHGKYCDPKSNSVERANILKLTIECKDELDEKVSGEIISTYNEYIAKADKSRQITSEDFFTKVGIFDILNKDRKHLIISRLCKQLLNVHYGWNNFYNEPPYAEYLDDVVEQSPIPDTVKAEFVEAVVICATGNSYGVSIGARPYYLKMIKNFSPKEMDLMMRLPEMNDYFRRLLYQCPNCTSNYKDLLKELQVSLLPTQLQVKHQQMIK